MLTDQALLARAYLHAWQETGSDNYLTVVTETLDFVLRDLSTPEGALYSSFDADAGGVEGSHATFTLAELAEALPAAPGPADGRLVRDHRGRQLGGPLHPVPARRRPAAAPARDRGGPCACWPRARRPRVQPARDEKVLTEWNAMAVATLAEVAAVTGSDRYARHGPRRSASSSCRRCTTDGRLMRSWQGGRARHLAVAADHAWLVEACVRLSELTGEALWRDPGPPGGARAARRCSGTTSPAASSPPATMPRALIVRPKEYLDGALPATNSIAVHALLRANALDDDERLRHAVDRTVTGARALLTRHPGALADMVAALPMLTGRQEIVVTGDRPDLLAEVRRHWLPDGRGGLG